MMQQAISQNGSVRVDGATLHYAIQGTGIPILVIGSAIYYPRTFSQQLRKSCRLTFVDLRHFAESDVSFSLDRITLNTYTEDIEQVRSTLGFERVVVIGHSHHGNLALEYAKRYALRVSHIVLIGTPPCNVDRTIEESCQYWAAHASEERKAILRRNRKAMSSDLLASMQPDKAFISQYVADGPKYWNDLHYDASRLWQGVPVNVDGVAQVKIGGDDAYIYTAAEQLLGKTDEEIHDVALQTLAGHLRAILGMLTVEQIYSDRDAFAQKVQQLAADDMASIGLQIVSFTIKDIDDEKGYLESLGRKRTAEVIRDAQIG
ncbi:MAG: alpha/beta fold hydrolase, partial [Acidimicrobiia bacterium]